MFNNELKKEALKSLDDATKKYDKGYENTIESVESLHNNKNWAVKILRAYEKYINSLANKPKEIEKRSYHINISRKEYEKEVERITLEAQKVNKDFTNTVGGGALAGAGVAAFGPTAAMAVATTFGTASTGTAIATLSGAAASHAALAWLGGGALAAGGGGMAAGQALLAMAGPVGWAIGAGAILGGGFLASRKNKKIAEEAEEKTEEILKNINELKKVNEKVKYEDELLLKIIKGIRVDLHYLIDLPIRDYRELSDKQKNILIVVINAAESLSKRIGVKIV